MGVELLKIDSVCFVGLLIMSVSILPHLSVSSMILDKDPSSSWNGCLGEIDFFLEGETSLLSALLVRAEEILLRDYRAL